MTSTRATIEQEVLDAQQQHWERTFAAHPEMYGQQPSAPARRAAEVFHNAGITRLLELGAGQGRDALFLAQRGFQVCALDYSVQGVDAIRHQAQALGVAAAVTAVCHDVRTPLPFADASFEGCYAHMLWCMAMTTAELTRLAGEVRRILRPGGINIYTVRNTHDAHYRTGIPRGEEMYEVGGFIVHFFSQKKVTQLAKGYEILSIEEFEEGELPRRLYGVTLRKR